MTAPAVFVDRDGEVWRLNGRTPDGDELMVCDNPSDPGDRGEGESFPWTRRTVEMWFGPLAVCDGATPVQEFVDLEVAS